MVYWSTVNPSPVFEAPGSASDSNAARLVLGVEDWLVKKGTLATSPFFVNHAGGCQKTSLKSPGFSEFQILRAFNFIRSLKSTGFSHRCHWELNLATLENLKYTNILWNIFMSTQISAHFALFKTVQFFDTVFYLFPKLSFENTQQRISKASSNDSNLTSPQADVPKHTARQLLALRILLEYR